MDEHRQTPPTLIGRGGSQSDLRRYNQRVVLAAIHRYPGLFNAELARRTGLAAQTISVILRSLKAQGLVRRGAVLRGRRGQPATPIFLNPEGAYSFGVEVGWRHVNVMLTDFSGHVLGEEVHPHAVPEPGAVVETVATSVERMLAGLPEAARPRARRLGLAMPVAFTHRLELFKDMPAETLAAWRSQGLADALQARLDMPVWTVGDGAAATSAEAAALLAERITNFAYLFVGPRLTGGMVLGGQLFEGPGGMAGAFGTLPVEGPVGARVCAGSVASLRALEARYGAAGRRVPILSELGADRSEVCEQWLGEAAHVLAQVVRLTHAVIDFPLFVLDGPLCRTVLSALVQRTSDRLAALAQGAGQAPLVIVGRSGASAAARGAAGVPLESEFFSPAGS